MMEYTIYDGLGVEVKRSHDLPYARSIAREHHGHVLDEAGTCVYDAADDPVIAVNPAHELIIEITVQVPEGTQEMTADDMGRVADHAAASVSMFLRASGREGMEVFRTVRVT